MRCKATWLPGLALLIGLALAFLSIRPEGLAAGPDVGPASGQAPGQAGNAYAGSPSCKSCHEKFYTLWAPSRHGLAMQPYADALGAGLLAPQAGAIAVGASRYQAFTGPGQGFVREIGPAGARDYPITQVLGGKNVCYFLTPLERGRLQTLPLAFDVNARQWFDTAASGLRHGPGQAAAQGAGQAAGRLAPDWRDPLYTFNTSCYNCHVSQLDTNYDPATDSYHTTWAEPGINCETCHGPSGAHNKACAAAPKGTVPKDLKIIRGGADFTAAQRNDACAACHAKMVPLTASFGPGERFCDHFDLVLLDSPDYYPDGRDLGENFTFTSWTASPCARSGKLDCMFCHTSSGRFKQVKDPNQACLPCHGDKAAGKDKHTRHAAESGPTCVACHMPQTSFARMRRSDHSMLPPTPAVTARFGSPNACQGCHKDKDAAWADTAVRSWRQRDYQAEVLHRTVLIDRARKRDFADLEPILDYLASPRRDEVFAASLIRLLRACPDGRKWPALRAAMADPSALVRASAASSLTENADPRTLAALAKACADPARLVRVRAAEALAGAPVKGLGPELEKAVAVATGELKASFAVRPDDWTGSYNYGNFLLRSDDPSAALDAYGRAMRLRPDAAAPCLNAAMAKARLGDLPGAETLLRQARANDPQNAAAAFNLGLVLAERGKPAEAATTLYAALGLDPNMAEAAYNLGLLTAKSDPAKAQVYLRQAATLRPDIPKYAKALRGLAPGADTAPTQAGKLLSPQGARP
jgi:tetratricopeptide (TPR) repeat protein